LREQLLQHVRRIAERTDVWRDPEIMKAKAWLELQEKKLKSIQKGLPTIT
jgi:hypothetical protein